MSDRKTILNFDIQSTHQHRASTGLKRKRSMKLSLPLLVMSVIMFLLSKNKEVSLVDRILDKIETNNMGSTFTSSSDIRNVSATSSALAASPNNMVVGGGPCPINDSNFHTIPHLEFIHIRKTGGTVIEDIAFKQYRIRWGRRKAGKKKWRVNETALGRKYGNNYHVPPQYFNSPNPLHDNNNHNASLFVVVRDPYDRAVSEFYQAHKHTNRKKSKGIHNAAKINDVKYMNIFIQKRIQQPKGDFLYCQYDYVFDRNNGNQIVDHVLHFETLHDEFNTLMRCYGLNITLPKKNVVNGRQQTAQLTSQNLTVETITMINEFEFASFEKFGYRMIG